MHHDHDACVGSNAGGSPLALVQGASDDRGWAAQLPQTAEPFLRVASLRWTRPSSQRVVQ